MKLLILLVAGLLSYDLISISVLVYDKKDSFQQPKTLSLNTYFSQKGKILTHTKESFTSLLANIAPSVLGSSTESTAPSKIIEQQHTTDAANQQTNKSQSAIHISNLTIAVLGDSMVDTLGPGLPHLANSLKQKYPSTKFTLLNYGAGGTNIESGLARLTQEYEYLGQRKPSLMSQNPDIVVIESFAYNHWENTESDINRHWLTLAKIIETIKSKNPDTKIVLATAIAPHCPTYTDGSANLPPERKYRECETVKAYLQNVVNFSSSQHYPLADAYHASVVGNEGNPKYINLGDHIHPSDAGKELFAQNVVAAIASELQ